ncbi:hypothetical protein CFC21_026051 [Triticum aestivum]|uniref:Uncharacterized protein n=3 Tax=Triticum TaxID=4564 RepID=A0A9R1Q221_TRITD|nr:uncharacterized protein LOC119368631 isoform X2 [Triticum dicoccoides]XP_044320843.1 uncharacterized protein LOC123042459 isoform X2 [Triticum aestivum]KAF7011780.1 hypothetical protein CFC21_026051 [Triticum aestivum]VAH53316.1 unnamed protein product [Triticum turgidum subsp. durum]
MRTSLMVLASLLLLLVLVTTAHGIRLDRHLHEALDNKERLAGQLTKPNGAADSAGSKPCTADGNCSGKAKKPPSPHAHAETDDDASAKHQIPPKRNDGNAQVTSHGGDQEEPTLPQKKKWSRRALPRRPKQQETRTYPDLIDIAGMDYSPAARKPPIHN